MFTLNCKGRLLVVDKPLVMGIINASPDSFYSGSRFPDTDALLRQAEKMIKEGADILDIGGQSTRPGSKTIGIDEELDRVIGPIESLRFNFPEIFISIDSFNSKVAREAVEAGASIVNDISGGSLDLNLIKTVALLNVPYVCTHIKGTPATMQQFARYENISIEVLDYFVGKIKECREAGIIDIIIDPGFGFAKNPEHNFELLKNLEIFKVLDCPLLSGLSRKSTIYRTLGITAEEALNGTTVLNTISLLNGADILRVHDVREAVEARKLVAAYNGS